LTINQKVIELEKQIKFEARKSQLWGLILLALSVFTAFDFFPQVETTEAQNTVVSIAFAIAGFLYMALAPRPYSKLLKTVRNGPKKNMLIQVREEQVQATGGVNGGSMRTIYHLDLFPLESLRPTYTVIIGEPRKTPEDWRRMHSEKLPVTVFGRFEEDRVIIQTGDGIGLWPYALKDVKKAA